MKDLDLMTKEEIERAEAEVWREVDEYERSRTPEQAAADKRANARFVARGRKLLEERMRRDFPSLYPVATAPTQSWLDARAVIAGDLYRDGEITQQECFRLEMDAALGENSGPINYQPGADSQ